MRSHYRYLKIPRELRAAVLDALTPEERRQLANAEVALWIDRRKVPFRAAAKIQPLLDRFYNALPPLKQTHKKGVMIHRWESLPQSTILSACAECGLLKLQTETGALYFTRLATPQAHCKFHWSETEAET